MRGDEITRSCETCAKSVTNLSAMTAREVRTFLRSTAGANGCVRVLRRDDDTIVTRDGALGVSRRRNQNLATTVAAAAAIAMNLAHGPAHLHEQIGCPPSDPLCSD